MTSLLEGRKTVFKHGWKVEAIWHRGHGGTPQDPKKAEAWLQAKIQDKDKMVQQLVAEIIVEQGLRPEEAVDQLAEMTTLVGFRRDETGLYIEGRQVKAMLKEGMSIALNGGHLGKGKAKTWGVENKKSLRGWFPEHVIVPEHKIYLGMDAPTRTEQMFIHTWDTHAIKYEEEVEEAKIGWTIVSDFPLEDSFWLPIMDAIEVNGLGASRSQGYGTLTITRWDRTCCETH